MAFTKISNLFFAISHSKGACSSSIIDFPTTWRDIFSELQNTHLFTITKKSSRISSQTPKTSEKKGLFVYFFQTLRRLGEKKKSGNVGMP